MSLLLPESKDVEPGAYYLRIYQKRATQKSLLPPAFPKKIIQRLTMFEHSDVGPKDRNPRVKLLRWLVGVLAVLAGAYVIYSALKQM
jgi:hypothetical protein